MPRPLPRRQTSSLPPPPRRSYTPYGIDETEADDYFQDRGRRSSTPGHDLIYRPRRRAESVNYQNRDSRRQLPASRGSYHRPSQRRSSSNSRYYGPQGDDQGRGRQHRHQHRPGRSTDTHQRGRRRRSPSSSSTSSSSSTWSRRRASSRSPGSDTSLSSHHHFGRSGGGGGHRRHRHHRHHHHHHHHEKAAHAQTKGKPENYYPPSTTASTTNNDKNKKKPILSRLRSQSHPAVLHRSSSKNTTTPHSRPRPRPRSASPAPKRTEPDSSSSKPAEILLRATQCAVEAGAVAALKMRDEPGPWLGCKGGKVAAAALSAAAVDTFMEQRHPKRKGGIRHTVMRQITQMALGKLVVEGGKANAGGSGGGGKGKTMGRGVRRVVRGPGGRVRR